VTPICLDDVLMRESDGRGTERKRTDEAIFFLFAEYGS
jgi:hypothetical protein